MNKTIFFLSKISKRYMSGESWDSREGVICCQFWWIPYHFRAGRATTTKIRWGILSQVVLKNKFKVLLITWTRKSGTCNRPARILRIRTTKLKWLILLGIYIYIYILIVIGDFTYDRYIYGIKLIIFFYFCEILLLYLENNHI